MNYSEYQNSRNLAWEVLLRERVTSLPVKISRICRQMGVQVRYYDPEDENDGYSTILDGEAVIFVKRDCYRPRQRFTVAHELGHILLGHVGKYELVNREPSPLDNPIEQSANVFAARVLAPACVLWALDAWTAEEIMVLCDISRQAAEYRAERMAELRQRGRFLSHPLEKQIYEQFKKFVENKQI